MDVDAAVGEDDASPRVAEYMTTDVSTVAPTDTVAAVSDRVAASDEHSGFPVVDDGHVVGFVTASDLLRADDDASVSAAMSEELLVAHPAMAVQDAARVILRSGIRKLPVVDDDGRLVGIIANTDVIRSQIERATPDKVERLVSTLESIHGVDASEERRPVAIDALTPTQDSVYGDELEGRTYELKRGLAEPLVVIDNGGGRTAAEDATAGGGERVPATPPRLFLADGHHRAKAAAELGIAELDAYVIALAEPVDLGMADAAAADVVADVAVEDSARHPLVERTERLQE